jgi:hypothetical protein
MTQTQFCTPDWLDECAKIYNDSPDLQKPLKKLSVKMAYRVNEEPEIGFEKSMIFCTFFEKGQLTKACLLSEEQAKEEAEFLVTAPVARWLSLLRKQSRFAVDFALKKVKLELGSKVGVLAVAPYGGHVVNMLTQSDVQFPDEMSKEEMEEYGATIEKLRTAL